jgi:hypothetical protein
VKPGFLSYGRRKLREGRARGVVPVHGHRKSKRRGCKITFGRDPSSQVTAYRGKLGWLLNPSLLSSGDKKNPDVQDKGAGNACFSANHRRREFAPPWRLCNQAVPAPHPAQHGSRSLLQLLPISLTKPARATHWVLPRFAPIAPPTSTKRSSELAH